MQKHGRGFLNLVGNALFPRAVSWGIMLAYRRSLPLDHPSPARYDSSNLIAGVAQVVSEGLTSSEGSGYA